MSARSLSTDTTRRGRLFFWVAAAGLLGLFPLFFVGGPGWSDGPLIHAAWNLGHPIFFALLTLTLRPWRFASGWPLWAASSAIVLLLGLGVELAQSFGNRDVDSRDMFRNLTGLWAVLALQPLVGFKHPYPLRDWLFRAVAAGLLSIDLMLVTHIAIQQIEVSHGLPQLYDFQQDHPERFWRGNVAKSGEPDCGPIDSAALSIELTTRRYSGASLDNLPADWRGYDQLEILLWNPQDYDIPLTLRINDLAHEQGSNAYPDRFNRAFRLTPGFNPILQDLSAIAQAPRRREMAMDSIRRLMLFTSDLEKPARICLMRLQLVNPHVASGQPR